VSKTKKPKSLIICVNRRLDPGRTSCAARGSEEIAKAIEDGVNERQINIEIERICCLGHCNDGPTMRMAPGGAFFHETGLDDVPQILDDLAARCGLR
jgi:NADH:ubiquinone oxidoreductase subunit E